MELMPQLVVFDLDYTLWDLWIDTHVVGPFKREGNQLNRILDQYNEPIQFYGHVPDILLRLKERGDLKIAVASRTSAPKLASEALSLLLIPSTSNKSGPATKAICFFDELEMYPGSKIMHFQRLHSRTSIPYSQMLFFDDELRNKEVESQLGVTFHLVKRGMNLEELEAGLKKWRERQSNITA